MPSFADRLSGIAGLVRPSRSSRERLREYQLKRLQSMVRHAAGNVPFYQASFRSAGVAPGNIRRTEDVAQLPLIGKVDVQSDPGSFLTRGIVQDQLIWYGTSGSTGQPMRVCRTIFEERLLQGFRIRAEKALGMRWTDRRAVLAFTGVPRGPRRVARTTALARFGILRRTVLDNTKPVRELIESLRQLKPEVIVGYPGNLTRVAGEMTDADRAVIRPRFLISGAEMLRAPARKLIEESFGAMLYDMYGAHECNLVAWECEQRQGLHLNEENVIVEVLRKDGREALIGEEGEVVITTLHSYAMPLLRYRLGDVVVRGADCPCGRPSSMIRAIQGRSAELAYLTDGQTVSAIDVANIFVARPGWIQQFQLVQCEPGKLQAYIVPGRPPQRDEVAAIEREACSMLSLQVSIELVRELPVRTSGKLPVFVNRVGA